MTRSGFVILGCLTISIITGPVRVSTAQDAPSPPDFRTLGAPPEVHICESRALLDLIKLTEEQRHKLAERLDAWKADYLARQAEIDKLPEDDLRGRRGWPPNRDRDLAAEIQSLLEDDQQEPYARVLALWSYGPVRFKDAQRRVYQSELGLTPDQYRELYALQVRWVQEAFPFVTAPGQPSLEDRFQAIVVIGTAGWKFKEERDAAWAEVLTEWQAQRWRQIEFQEHLGVQGVRFLVTGRSPPQTSTSYAHFVPYFESPAESLNLNDEQKAQILEICAEYEQALNPYDQSDLDRETRIAILREQKNAFLRRVEEVFTVEQRQRWQELLGEPSVYTQWLED